MTRDEIANALMEVVGGRIPLDRIALKELHRELVAWPYLDSVEELQAEQQAESNYGGVTDTGTLSSFWSLLNQILNCRSRACNVFPAPLYTSFWGCDVYVPWLTAKGWVHGSDVMQH